MLANLVVVPWGIPVVQANLVASDNQVESETEGVLAIQAELSMQMVVHMEVQKVGQMVVHMEAFWTVVKLS